jgi:hypothetical protein
MDSTPMRLASRSCPACRKDKNFICEGGGGGQQPQKGHSARTRPRVHLRAHHASVMQWIAHLLRRQVRVPYIHNQHHPGCVW